MGENHHGRKIPLPRKLEYRESAASLRQWKTHFINYTRTDIFFAKFVQADTEWKTQENDWGFEDEPAASQTKRTKAQVKDDCLMFLETLSSYLPDDYIGEKICKMTKNLKEVWSVIDDFFGVTLSSETYLELTKLSKKQNETYRQFYLRLEGFVSKHLTKGGVKIEEMQSPARGDIMTISIKNLVVIIWMTKIHPKLVDCVKIDFSQELRGGKELVELMGRIADNVDNILARHDISGAVSMVKEDDAVITCTMAMSTKSTMDSEVGHAEAAEVEEGSHPRGNRAVQTRRAAATPSSAPTATTWPRPSASRSTPTMKHRSVGERTSQSDS